LERFDVSQCKNLGRWIEAGGIESVKSRGRNVGFVTVSDGRWRDGKDDMPSSDRQK
jgi:F-box/leucine-rich repeat protein 7